MEEYITRFSTYLFWDVNKDDLDMEKHSQYIIKRVLEYGMLQDWNIVKQYYGLGRIVEIAKGFRELEPRALAYLSAISQTPKEQLDVTLINGRIHNTGTFKKVATVTCTL